MPRVSVGRWSASNQQEFLVNLMMACGQAGMTGEDNDVLGSGSVLIGGHITHAQSERTPGHTQRRLHQSALSESLRVRKCQSRGPDSCTAA